MNVLADLSQCADVDIIAVSSDAEAELKKRGYDYGWYKTEPYVGSIYILVNPAFPNLVKIGYADDVQKRMRSLNGNSGLPDPFHCYAIYKVKKRLEDLKLHGLIDSLDSSLRHSRNREFYEMDAVKAYSILSAIAQISGDEEQLVLNPFNDDYFDSGFRKVSPIVNNVISADGKNGNPAVVVQQPSVGTDSDVVHTLDEDVRSFTHSKPIKLFVGGEEKQVMTWSEFYEVLCKTLFEKNRCAFLKIVASKQVSSLKTDITGYSPNVRFVEMTAGAYARVSMSASDVLTSSKSLIKMFDTFAGTDYLSNVSFVLKKQ